MAEYQVLYWREIPSLVKATDGTSEATTLELSHRRRVWRMTVDAHSGQILFFPPSAPAS